MSNAPFPLWTAAANDAAFTDPAACAARAGTFEREIARRNRRERLAGWIQLPVWAGLAGFFLSKGEWLTAFSLLLCGAGVLLVLRNLSRRAGNLQALVEEPCLSYLERQYRHQHAALRSVPLWYVGPLVPGTLAFFAAVTARVAESKGWSAALEGAAVPFAVTFGIFLAVILLNRLAARSIAADIARISALAPGGQST
jgi:hypothetical protein